MKTVFKKGMKVYDQLIFPDKEGIVLTTNYIPEKFFDEDDFDENYVHPYPIEVEFGSETMLYTSDGDSGMCGLKTLSTKPYKVEFQGFEQKASAPTYEDIVKERNYIYLPENLVAPNKELADAVVALLKLLFLRDYYNEGWQPDWEDKNNDGDKYCIMLYKGELTAIEYSYTYEVLHFKTPEIRNKFLKEQRKLLEIAKPLL
jgi:hypothetical protein|nr:MAG TPA: hypothetical protein [Caudoviricetes sp.]